MAFAALLRGINVGGKNKLSMRDLAAMFSEAGCDQVQTYIQSGNVVFTATSKIARRIPALLPNIMAERWGLKVPVVIRTAGEIRKIVEDNPFRRSDSEAGSLHVGFLSNRPEKRRIDALDPHRSPGDSFQVCGREIYLCLPNGMARSRLTNDYFDSMLATTSTFRNWRTTFKLAEMATKLLRS